MQWCWSEAYNDAGIAAVVVIGCRNACPATNEGNSLTADCTCDAAVGRAVAAIEVVTVSA